MGVDDVHANASSLSCFSCCFVFLCIGAKGGMGAFRIGFCGVFLKFPDSAVPTLGFSHMPAWTSMCMYCGFHVLFLFLLCTSVGSGDGGMLMMLVLFCMMLIAYAEDTIPTVITMTMTLLLPVALVVTLLFRCHQCKTLVFSRLSKQKLRN